MLSGDSCCYQPTGLFGKVVVIVDGDNRRDFVALPSEAFESEDVFVGHLGQQRNDRSVSREIRLRFDDEFGKGQTVGLFQASERFECLS
jgi:hypothetical protein